MPANYSSLYRQGASAQTETVVSSRFKIYSPVVNLGKFQRIGVTSSFAISETRAVETIRGLGYGDQVAELVPSVTEPIQLVVARTALYLANIMQMMGYKAGVSGAVRSLKHHKWPFDIRTDIVFSELASDEAENYSNQALAAPVPNEGGKNNLGNLPPGLFCVSTLYEGCWMSSYSTSFAIATAAVAEDVTIICTDIFDNNSSVYGEFIDSGNNQQDVTGRSLIFSENNINQ